jgi:hypothetical protein
MPPVSEAENAPGFEFRQLERSIGAAHRPATATSSDLLQRLFVTRSGHAKRAFEHLSRSGKHAGLYGHVSPGLFERHTIPHTVGRIASGRHALLLRLSAPRR